MVAANKNVAVSLFVGILVAVGFGVFAMIFNFLPLTFGNVVVVDSLGDIFGILAGISGALLILSLTLLFVNLNKRYMKIVP